MSEPLIYLAIACIALAGIWTIVYAMLHGWRDWIALKKLELERGEDARPSQGSAPIELADLKERIRKLEAIASGID